MISAILGDAGRAERPCLVGHDPDFSEMLGDLVGLAAVPMRKGAIARVDVADRHLVAGQGTLRYLLPPELLPRQVGGSSGQPSRSQRQRIVCTSGAPGSTTSGAPLTASGGPLWGSTHTACSGSV